MRRALAMLVLLVLVAPAARADKATAEARALYDKAIAHYDLADYATAISEFKQAYALTREPALLFNLAQACRLQKDYQQALYFYETYLQLMPHASNRADAADQALKMKKEIEAAKARAAETPPPVVPAPAPVVAPPPSPAPPPQPAVRFVQTTRGRVTIALAAVGGAALIAAAGTGGEALAIRSRYDAGCTSGPCDGGLYSRGHGYAIATDVLLSVGVAAAVVATVVALARRHERPLVVGARF